MTILIVEDYPELRHMLRAAIAREAPQAVVLEADNLDDAVMAIEKRKDGILTRPDAILCDATFPAFPDHKIPFGSRENPPRIMWHQVAGYAAKHAIPFALLSGAAGEVDYAKRKRHAAFLKPDETERAVAWVLRQGQQARQGRFDDPRFVNGRMMGCIREPAEDDPTGFPYLEEDS